MVKPQCSSTVEWISMLTGSCPQLETHSFSGGAKEWLGGSETAKHELFIPTANKGSPSTGSGQKGDKVTSRNSLPQSC